MTEDFRIRLNGSSFNYDHLFVVLSAWAVNATSPVVSAFPVTEMEIQGAGEKLELCLNGLGTVSQHIYLDVARPPRVGFGLISILYLTTALSSTKN